LDSDDYSSSSDEDDDEYSALGAKKPTPLVKKVEAVIREGEAAILKSEAIVYDAKVRGERGAKKGRLKRSDS